jgi:hypothetical protein
MYWARVEPSPLLLWPFIGLLYQPWMIDGDECGAITGRGNWSTRRKPVPVPLSTTDPTWLDLGSNPGRRGGKQANNRLRYGTAF